MGGGGGSVYVDVLKFKIVDKLKIQILSHRPLQLPGTPPQPPFLKMVQTTATEDDNYRSLPERLVEAACHCRRESDALRGGSKRRQPSASAFVVFSLLFLLLLFALAIGYAIGRTSSDVPVNRRFGRYLLSSIDGAPRSLSSQAYAPVEGQTCATWAEGNICDAEKTDGFITSPETIVCASLERCPSVSTACTCTCTYAHDCVPIAHGASF